MTMNVRVWEPGCSGTGRISQFLSAHQIRHTLIRSTELRGVTRPALVVDDEIFVEPNDHALRRLLGLS